MAEKSAAKLAKIFFAIGYTFGSFGKLYYTHFLCSLVTIFWSSRFAPPCLLSPWATTPTFSSFSYTTVLWGGVISSLIPH